jgi:hypothetical protein
MLIAKTCTFGFKWHTLLSRQPDDHFGGQCASVEACRGAVLQASQEAVHIGGLDTISAI